MDKKDFRKPNVIMEKSLDFVLWIIEFTHELTVLKYFTLKDQLFKAGTAIGALIREAQSPESKKDFIHKMKFAAKEADETEYWLQLCSHSPLPPTPPKLGFNNEMQKILSKILATSRASLAH